MKNRINCIFFFCAAATYVSAQDSIGIRYSNNISEASLRKSVYTLASDDFEGREAGTEGQKKAARFISGVFQEAGLTAMGDTGFSQKFTIEKSRLGEQNMRFRDKALEPGYDFFAILNEGENKGNITKLLLIKQGSDVVLPTDTLPAGIGVGIYAEKQKNGAFVSPNDKVQKLRKIGAEIVFVIYPGAKSVQSLAGRLKSEERIIKPSSTSSNKSSVVAITKAAFKRLLKKSKKERRSPANNISSTMSVLSSPIEYNISNTNSSVSSENVIGMVEGSELKQEYVVVSGHYDHLGKHGDKIYYGADDDGSGTSAVIELAKVFGAAKKDGFGPKRSILFMTFSAEEKGLLGSTFYTSNPIVPLASTVADLNIDMIGRIDAKHATDSCYIYIIGSDKLSKSLHEINELANTNNTKLSLDYTYNDDKDPNRFYYRSDHYNFAKNKIPVIFYFNGTHEDYHRVTDTADKINTSLMTKRTKLVFLTAWELANRIDRIELDQK